jgi:hypothetical protein
MKKIIVFDFDGTLFFTPGRELGEPVWLEKTGMEWMYNGWWSKPETLNTEIFDIPINPYVYNEYRKWLNDPDAILVLATGRLKKLEDLVKGITDSWGLEFDYFECNSGGETFRFKTRLFEKLIDRYNPEFLRMYDDRWEHLVKFKEWAVGQKTTIEIIDVTKTDKTPKIIIN